MNTGSIGKNQTRNNNMDKKSIHIIPSTGEKDKLFMLPVKFMARAGIKGYYVLLRGDMKTPADDALKKQGSQRYTKND